MGGGCAPFDVNGDGTLDKPEKKPYTRIRVADVLDGTSKTIAIGEAAYVASDETFDMFPMWMGTFSEDGSVLFKTENVINCNIGGFRSFPMTQEQADLWLPAGSATDDCAFSWHPGGVILVSLTDRCTSYGKPVHAGFLAARRSVRSGSCSQHRMIGNLLQRSSNFIAIERGGCVLLRRRASLLWPPWVATEPYELAPVHGNVTIDGRPVSQAKVMFAPVENAENAVNPGKPAFGLLGEDGGTNSQRTKRRRRRRWQTLGDVG